MNQQDPIAYIKHHARSLHEKIGHVIDEYMLVNELAEDNMTLNIVFNALSNNLQAIIEGNRDITGDSVELMIERLAFRMRKAYQSRTDNQN